MWWEKNQVYVDAVLCATSLKLFTQKCRCRNWVEISGSVLEAGELELDCV